MRDPETQGSLGSRAFFAGVSIVNEVGLDPGIDHLLAMECIDNVHEKGGKVNEDTAPFGPQLGSQGSVVGHILRFLLRRPTIARMLRESAEVQVQLESTRCPHERPLRSQVLE